MTYRSRRPHRHDARDGQALVEFAVIGLIMLTMSFGVLEMGRAFYASIAVTHAARDGARVAMNPAATDAAIVAAASAAADPVTLSEVRLARSTTIGELTTVTAVVEFEPVAPLIAELWGGGPLVISESATSRTGWDE